MKAGELINDFNNHAEPKVNSLGSPRIVAVFKSSEKKLASVQCTCVLLEILILSLPNNISYYYDHDVMHCCFYFLEFPTSDEPLLSKLRLQVGP